MPRPRTLLKVPLEIFEHITSELSLGGLQAIRLTCKETSENSSCIFVSKFFTERAFLLSNEDSLRTLLSIAEHEKFGRSMQTVAICIDELPPEEDSDDEDLPDDELRMHHGERPILGQPLQTPQQEGKWKAMLEQQQHFQERNFDCHLLAMIFRSFMRLGNAVEVKIVDTEKAGMATRQAGTIQRLCGKTLSLPENESRATRIPLKALALSSLPVEKFSMDAIGWNWSIYALPRSDRALSDAQNIFADLKHLHIRFDTLYSVKEKYVKGFIDLVACARNLETLSLYNRRLGRADGESKDPFHTLYNLLWKCEFPALKVMDLQGFFVEFNDMVDFLPRHGKLKEMHIHANYFPDEKCSSACPFRTGSEVPEELRDTGLTVAMDEMRDRLKEETRMEVDVVPWFMYLWWVRREEIRMEKEMGLYSDSSEA